MEKYEIIKSEITADYIRWNDDGIIRFIPIDEANSDYQAYLRWLENPTSLDPGSGEQTSQYNERVKGEP